MSDLFSDVSNHAELYLAAVKAYFINTDEGNFHVLIDSFADGAEFHFLGQSFRGKEEIKQFMERERPPEDKLFHHVTDVSVTGMNGASGTGRTQLLVHFDRWEEGEDGEKVNVKGLVSGVYHDEFVIENGVCKFTKRTMDPRVFTQY